MPGVPTVLSQIRDGQQQPATLDRYAAAQQIARQMGIPVEQVLAGLAAQGRAGPSYLDNGDPAQATMAARYDDQAAMAKQAAKAVVKGEAYPSATDWANDRLTTLGNEMYAGASDLRAGQVQNVLSQMRDDYSVADQLRRERLAKVARDGRNRGVAQGLQVQNRMAQGTNIMNAKIGDERNFLTFLSRAPELLQQLGPRLNWSLRGSWTTEPQPVDAAFDSGFRKI